MAIQPPPEISPYQRSVVFWGIALPTIYLYDSEGVLLSVWYFDETDNAKFEYGVERVIDSRVETEGGLIRERLRGFRLSVSMFVENVANRSFMKFLRLMGTANEIVIEPHYLGMQNPDDQTYRFRLILNSDFEPRYINQAYIGHSISMDFIGRDLLSDIPIDVDDMALIPAIDVRAGGVTTPDEQFSMTYPNEKQMYGGWETTDEQLKEIAYVETYPAGEGDPRGV